MPQLVFAFDVVNQLPVLFQGSAGALPPLRQGKYDVTIYLVSPEPLAIPGAPTYSPIDATAYDGLRVGIWSNSTGTRGDEDALLLALTDQLGWTYTEDDDGNACFTGSLNVNTDEMAAFIGANKTASAYFAINLVKGLDLYPVFDQRNGTNCTIYSATDGGSSYSIITTQGTPFLPVGTQLRGAGGEVWGFVDDPSNPGNLMITRVS